MSNVLNNGRKQMDMGVFARFTLATYYVVATGAIVERRHRRMPEGKPRSERSRSFALKLSQSTRSPVIVVFGDDNPETFRAKPGRRRGGKEHRLIAAISEMARMLPGELAAAIAAERRERRDALATFMRTATVHYCWGVKTYTGGIALPVRSLPYDRAAGFQNAAAGILLAQRDSGADAGNGDSRVRPIPA